MGQGSIIVKTILATIAVMLLIFLAHTYLFTPATIGDGTSTGGSGSIQKITLSFRDENYYPEVITVKVNRPVEITADASVDGCAKSIVMPEFGINKILRPGDDKITFTPTKIGDFVYTCSMGMYKGTIKVVA